MPPHPPLLLPTLHRRGRTFIGTRRPVSPELTDKGGGVSRISKGLSCVPAPDTSTLSAKAFTLSCKILDADEAAPNERLHLVHLDAQGSLPTLPTRGSFPPRCGPKRRPSDPSQKDMKASHLCRPSPREVKEIPPHGGSISDRPLLLVVRRFRPPTYQNTPSQEAHRAGT